MNSYCCFSLWRKGKIQWNKRKLPQYISIIICDFLIESAIKFPLLHPLNNVTSSNPYCPSSSLFITIVVYSLTVLKLERICFGFKYLTKYETYWTIKTHNRPNFCNEQWCSNFSMNFPSLFLTMSLNYCQSQKVLNTQIMS